MRKLMISALSLFAVLGFAAPALADTGLNVWTYNPDSLTGISSSWEPSDETKPMDKDACKNGGYSNYKDQNGLTFKNQGQCISYFNKNGAPNEFLVLTKDQPTSANAASGAEITGVEGTTLTSLGFDYMGYCGAGAPRFNVYTTSGVYYFFGCAHGTHTDLGSGWHNVTFSNADAYASDGTTAFPGFGSTTVTGIEIVMDEMGSVTLDNININGTVISGQ